MRAPIIAAVGLAAAAGIAWFVNRTTPAAAQPGRGGFAVWQLEAGGEFAPLRARAEAQQLGSWGCARLEEHHEVCEINSEGLPTTGVPGRIRVLVDSSGRIIALRFAPATGQAMALHAARMSDEWKEELGAMTDAWQDADGTATSMPAFERGTSFTTWQSADKRWSAATLADSTDRVRYVLLADNRLLASFVAPDPVRALLLYEAGFEGLTTEKAIAAGVAVQLARGGEGAERLWRW